MEMMVFSHSHKISVQMVYSPSVSVNRHKATLTQWTNIDRWHLEMSHCLATGCDWSPRTTCDVGTFEETRWKGGSH